MVHPTVLGSGQRFFRAGSETTALRLVETKTFSSGVVALTYQPVRAGPILAHRWYLGYALDEALPDQSSLTRIRARLARPWVSQP